MSVFGNTHAPAVVNAEESAPNRELAQPQRGARERELLQVLEYPEDRNPFFHFIFQTAVILSSFSHNYEYVRRLLINSVMLTRC